MSATVTKQTLGQVDCVAIGGRLTAAEAATVRAEVLEVIEQGNAQLVLDLAALEFCDSSGLSVLISALRAARSRDGNVALAALTPAVRALIELTRLHQVFEIFDDAPLAAERMVSGPPTATATGAPGRTGAGAGAR